MMWQLIFLGGVFVGWVLRAISPLFIKIADDIIKKHKVSDGASTEDSEEVEGG